MGDTTAIISSQPPPASPGTGYGRYVPLQDKLLLGMVTLVIASLAFAGAGFLYLDAQQAEQATRSEAQRVAMTASSLALPLAEENDRAALAKLAAILSIPTDVQRIRFLALDGGVVADSHDDRHKGSPPVEALQAHAVLPLEPRKSASLRVAVWMNTGIVAQQSQEMARKLLGAGLAVLGVALPIVFLLVHRTFSPIRRLSVAARKVASGRFETVDIRRGDALGVLADSFNDMVLRLAEQIRRVDEARQSLLEANQTLEDKVLERTSAIELASQRLASEIAEKEDFLRAIGHDLNAPLRNIDGMVTMLLRKHAAALPEEVSHRLQRIKKNVEHEAELINDLLELSRIKTRREQSEPINLDVQLQNLRDVFENDLREQSIELIIDPRLPVLIAEKGRIRQVFQNLIDNAIKYMGDSTIRRISVGARRGRSEALFWVRDTGQGIAADDIEKVFYVFRRGSRPTRVAGKGVGLASVKSIIENYHGNIWVESAPGVGSTFFFTLNGRFVAGLGTTDSHTPHAPSAAA